MAGNHTILNRTTVMRENDQISEKIAEEVLWKIGRQRKNKPIF